MGEDVGTESRSRNLAWCKSEHFLLTPYPVLLELGCFRQMKPQWPPLDGSTEKAHAVEWAALGCYLGLVTSRASMVPIQGCDFSQTHQGMRKELLHQGLVSRQLTGCATVGPASEADERER